MILKTEKDVEQKLLHISANLLLSRFNLKMVMKTTCVVYQDVDVFMKVLA